MKTRSLLQLAALGGAVIGLAMVWQARQPEAPAAPEDRPAAPSAPAAPPAIRPPQGPAAAVGPSEWSPGHFPGVSVRHQPGGDPTAEGDPPAGVPHEVETTDGKRLIRTLTDERHAIPLRPPAQP